MRRTNYLGLGVGYQLGEHPGQADEDLVRVTLDYVALHAFATDARTTGGLVYGWLGGNIADPYGAYVQVPGGTVAVAPNSVTYVERTDVGAVTTNTTDWTIGLYPMARVTTDAVGITNVEDFRPAVLPGVQGPKGDQGPQGNQGPAGPAMPTDMSWLGAQYSLVRKPSTLQPPAMSASTHHDAGFGVGDGTSVLFPIRRTTKTVSAWGGTWPVYTKPRTNLCPRSQEFDQWSSNGGTVTPNYATAPDGTATADLFDTMTAAGQGRYRFALAPVGVLTTMSVYFKPVSTFVFRMGSDAVHSTFDTQSLAVTNVGGAVGSVVSVGGGWYRAIVTYYPPAAAVILYKHDAGTGSCLFWGAQLEAGTTATRYIPTTTAAVTVNPDFTSTDWEPVLDYAPTAASGLPTTQLWNTWEAARVPYEVARTNLQRYSQEFDNVAWSKQLGITVTPNATVAPDGTTTADALVFSGTANNRVEHTWGMTSYTGPMVFSVWLKGTAGETVNLVIDDTAGTSGETTITLTSSWARYSVPVSLISKTAWRSMIVKRSTNTAGTVYAWGAQVEQASAATAYIPTQRDARVVPPEYLGNPTLYLQDWQGKRMLYPTPRTNLLARSQELDQSPWGKSAGITITPNTTTAPDGTSTADTIAKTANAFYAVNQAFTFSGSGNVTASIYIKAGTLSVATLAIIGGSTDSRLVFDLSTGSQAQNTSSGYVRCHALNVGGGWYRLSLTAVGVVGTMTCYLYPGNLAEATAGDIIAWGAQVEAGDYPTPYIPTTTAAVTRTDYSLGPDGEVTLAVAPAAGAVLSWLGAAPSYTAGPTFIVPASAVGAWSGQAGKLARWTSSAWVFEAPATDRRVFAFDQARWLRWDGSAWSGVATQVLTWTYPSDSWATSTKQPPVRMDQPGRILAVRHFRDNTTPPSVQGTAQLRVNGSSVCTINVATGDANQTWIADTVTAPALAAGATLQPVVTATGAGVGDITVQVDIEKP